MPYVINHTSSTQHIKRLGNYMGGDANLEKDAYRLIEDNVKDEACVSKPFVIEALITLEEVMTLDSAAHGHRG
jgi:hypothetical protein